MNKWTLMGFILGACLVVLYAFPASADKVTMQTSLGYIHTNVLLLNRPGRPFYDGSYADLDLRYTFVRKNWLNGVNFGARHGSDLFTNGGDYELQQNYIYVGKEWILWKN